MLVLMLIGADDSTGAGDEPLPELPEKIAISRPASGALVGNGFVNKLNMSDGSRAP